MITPATKTPKNMTGIAFFKRRSRNTAIAAPETGKSEIFVLIHLKEGAQVEQVLRAAKEIRDVFFPVADVKIFCEENYKEIAVAKTAALSYQLDFEEL